MSMIGTDHETPMDDVLSSVWDANASNRCVVCNRPTGGKAICDDVRCAEELANG